MRIVHVVDYLMPALGYQEYILPKWNARHGHDVAVVTSDRYTPIPHYEETWGEVLGSRVCGAGRETTDGMLIVRLEARAEVKARPWLKDLDATLRELEPDVLFSHGTASPTAFRVARFARRHHVPLLMDNHMTYTAQNRSLLGRAYWTVLRLGSAYLARPTYRFLGVAEECCEFLRSEQALPARLVECLPLGVDTEQFSFRAEDRDRTRARHQIDDEAVVVMQTGKLSPDKAPHLLAKALAPVMATDPRVVLVFLGAGSDTYLDKVREPLRRADVLEQTRFMPFMPAAQLSEWYSAADVCVYPAASSLSALEAAACGRAVVMADLPTGRWRAGRGVGICYPTGQVGELRRTLVKMIDDPAYRQGLGERGHHAVVSEFSYGAVARRAEGLMREAVLAHG